ncbi:MAG: ATP-dependent Clp protease adapter ClpS [Desulfobacterales bacterium]|nr:ATP-dependent Clp protease adapter ClpS [Desulfobacterales bacterium]MDJ0914039.1 ATP-dependent Clp protease adapter ClpS [Desulfobacterales bacterium]
MSEYHPDSGEELDSEVRDELDEPPMYSVLLLNDDYTTMEFVVQVLMFVFNKTTEEATRIMMNVHNNGVGHCGTFTFEIAETKVDMVHKLARENNFPLKCTMERE